VIKRALAATLLFTAFALPLHADFAAIARALESKRGVHRVWIPFLGIARAAVWVVRPEGVRDFQLATFESNGEVDPRELQNLMREKVGPGFTPLVQVMSRRSGEWTSIYAKPSADGKRIELMVLVHDDEETVLVRVDVDGNAVARHLEVRPRNVVNMARR
jgi:hypothetical protein